MSAPVSEPKTPALAAIVVIPDTFSAVARTVAKLQNQTVVSEIELVLVHLPQAYSSIPFDKLTMFHSVETRELDSIVFAPAMAEGVRAAHAPFVAFTEDHSFPAPNWAECLIGAHRRKLAPNEKPIAVVGPAMRCGNPHSGISLADFYIGYGKWAAPIESGPQDFVMGHNGCYSRALLMEYDARLDSMLDAETVLQFDLARRGYQFWLAADTYTEHLNFENLDIWVRYLIYYGRVFAASRSVGWNPLKRIFYAAASPLIPFVRFARTRSAILRGKFPPGKRMRLYGITFAGLVLDAAGQSIGYLFGEGRRTTEQLELEFHRERYIKSSYAASAE